MRVSLVRNDSLNRQQSFKMRSVEDTLKIGRAVNRITKACEELIGLTESSVSKGECGDFFGEQSMELTDKFTQILKIIKEQRELKAENDELAKRWESVVAAFGE